MASWLRDAAKEAQRPDLTLRAAEAANDLSPSLADYNLICELSGDDWSKKKEGLLQRIRKSNTDGAEAVAIFLQEELWDDALKTADKSYDSGLLVSTFRAVTSHRPDRVFSLATRRAEEIMDAGKANHYDSAISWLEYARTAYKTADKLPEWKVYLDKLLVAHGRKYKLVPMLRELA